MPQNEYIEEAIKKHGRRLNHEEKKRKKEAREVHKLSTKAQKLHGLKAKLYNRKRYTEKIEMKKQYVSGFDAICHARRARRSTSRLFLLVALNALSPSRIKAHAEKSNRQTAEEPVQEGAIPAFLMDREQQTRAKVLSNMIKQKRKEKAGKWSVPLPKVKAVDEAEMFRVLKSGKRKSTCIVCPTDFPPPSSDYH